MFRSALILGLAAVLTAGVAHGGPVGPTPYLCFDTNAIAGCGASDSPFKSIDFSGGYFYFEDFEDVLFNTPGVSADGILSTAYPPFQIDSVDEDDGTINGSGAFTTTYSNGNVSSGPKSITFDFDAVALGGFPTHVGLAWTDGLGLTTFEAFDAFDVSQGAIGPVDISDVSITGETAEDHFLGWIEAQGISRIVVSDDATGLEIDHLQYGREMLAVPAPESVRSDSWGHTKATYR